MSYHIVIFFCGMSCITFYLVYSFTNPEMNLVNIERPNPMTKKNRNEIFTFRLPSEEKAALVKRAMSENISTADLVLFLIRNGMESKPKAKPVRAKAVAKKK